MSEFVANDAAVQLVEKIEAVRSDIKPFQRGIFGTHILEIGGMGPQQTAPGRAAVASDQKVDRVDLAVVVDIEIVSRNRQIRFRRLDGTAEKFAFALGAHGRPFSDIIIRSGIGRGINKQLSVAIRKQGFDF